MEVGGQLHASAGTHWIGGRMGPRTGLDVGGGFLPGMEPRSSSHNRENKLPISTSKLHKMAAHYM